MFDATVSNISFGFPYLNPWGDVYSSLPVQYSWSVSACNANGCLDSEKRNFTYSMKSGDVGTVKAKAGSKKGFIDLSWEMGKYTPTSTYYLFKNDLVAKMYSFTKVSVPSYPPETFGTSDLRVDSAKPNVLHWTGDKNFFNCGQWDLGVVACDQDGKQCSVSSSFTHVDMKRFFACIGS